MFAELNLTCNVTCQCQSAAVVWKQWLEHLTHTRGADEEAEGVSFGKGDHKVEYKAKQCPAKTKNENQIKSPKGNSGYYVNEGIFVLGVKRKSGKEGG